VVDVQPDLSFETVELVRSSLRLGEGWTAQHQNIDSERMEQAVSALSAFVGQALLLDAEQILCSATAALREADNRDEFIQRVEAELSLPLRVLSGVEEAAIVYRGTRKYVEEDVLMVDLGGRSTELVRGAGPRPDACLSLPIGHLSLYSDHPYAQPTAPGDWERLLKAAMDPILDVPEEAGADCILCSPSGAVRTLARMVATARGEAPKGRGDGLAFNQEELAAVVADLQGAYAQRLVHLPGIDPRRADTLLAAAAIVQALMMRFSQEQIFAVRGGLREGLILEWAESRQEG
jgi:exopolyphosphatase/guanosine-5'-triphosphate,3'-diphosphate pyrophosphatase